MQPTLQADGREDGRQGSKSERIHACGNVLNDRAICLQIGIVEVRVGAHGGRAVEWNNEGAKNYPMVTRVAAMTAVASRLRTATKPAVAIAELLMGG